MSKNANSKNRTQNTYNSTNETDRTTSNSAWPRGSSAQNVPSGGSVQMPRIPRGWIPESIRS